MDCGAAARRGSRGPKTCTFFDFIHHYPVGGSYFVTSLNLDVTRRHPFAGEGDLIIYQPAIHLPIRQNLNRNRRGHQIFIRAGCNGRTTLANGGGVNIRLYIKIARRKIAIQNIQEKRTLLFRRADIGKEGSGGV